MVDTKTTHKIVLVVVPKMRSKISSLNNSTRCLLIIFKKLMVFICLLILQFSVEISESVLKDIPKELVKIYSDILTSASIKVAKEIIFSSA